MDSEQELSQLERASTTSRPGQPPQADDGTTRAQHSRKDTYRLIAAASLLQFPIWGFAMTFGIFQQAFAESEIFQGADKSNTGLIGTTLNGVMYLSMPVLFTFLDTGRFAHLRKHFAYAGTLLASTSFLLSSFSTQVWHLILLQGVLAALGCAMIYSPTTLLLDTWFLHSNRSLAYGTILSSKNIVGTGTPFLMHYLLTTLSHPWTLRIWALLTLLTSLLPLSLLPPSPPLPTRPRFIPLTFLKHPTFYIYTTSNILQSAAYALPQTYLPQYASTTAHLPTPLATLLLSLFNLPGIFSCIAFAWLGGKPSISPSTNTLISALGSGICVVTLWGAADPELVPVLVAFCVGFGFFAGGYSSTWGGWVREMEGEAREGNEALYTGMLYGLFNGARRVGYVISGPIGVALLEKGPVGKGRELGFGTEYGGVMVFAGVCSTMGGFSWVFRRCGWKL